MESNESDYMAFLLRLWRVNTDRGCAWRASLEDPHSGAQRGFADLEALFFYLCDECYGDSIGPTIASHRRRLPR